VREILVDGRRATIILRDKNIIKPLPKIPREGILLMQVNGTDVPMKIQLEKITNILNSFLRTNYTTTSNINLDRLLV